MSERMTTWAAICNSALLAQTRGETSYPASIDVLLDTDAELAALRQQTTELEAECNGQVNDMANLAELLHQLERERDAARAALTPEATAAAERQAAMADVCRLAARARQAKREYDARYGNTQYSSPLYGVWLGIQQELDEALDLLADLEAPDGA